MAYDSLSGVEAEVAAAAQAAVEGGKAVEPAGSAGIAASAEKTAKADSAEKKSGPGGKVGLAQLRADSEKLCRRELDAGGATSKRNEQYACRGNARRANRIQ